MTEKVEEISAETSSRITGRGAEFYVLVATIGASAMAFIDGTVVQIALPAIQSDFQTSFATLQWIVNIYMLFLGALVLVGGAFGDLLGRRLIFTWGIVVFVLASLGCGLAPTDGFLIVARAIQGIGGAMLVPQSLAIISACFPKETRGRAIGTWAAASSLTTAIGPVIGGYFVDAISWRAAFLINVPIGIVALAVTILKVPESRAPGSREVDFIGGLLATLGLGGLTVALIYLPTHGLADPMVLAGIVLAVVGLPAFVFREARIPAPMMPLTLFGDAVFTRVNILTVLLYGALASVLFLVPYTLIQVWGYSATEAGLALLPLGIILGVLSRLAGAIGDQIGTRLPMIVGTSIVALSMLVLAWTQGAGGYWVGVFGPISGIAFGMAILVSPLTTTVMNSAGAERSGVASGINNAAARVAGLLAVAISGALSVAIFAASLRGKVGGLGLSPEAASALLGGADKLMEAPLPAGLGQAEAANIRSALSDAYLWAFRVVLIVNACLTAAGAAIAWTLPETAGKQVQKSDNK